jgi:DNA-directed RNA polymerase subunit RPC12/RpoP
MQQTQNDLKETPQIKCPKCGSTQITAGKKGFSGKKAVAGALLTGGVGLLAGTIGSNKIKITCLNCANEFKPGDKPAEKKLDASQNNSGCMLFIIIALIAGLSLMLSCNHKKEKEPETFSNASQVPPVVRDTTIVNRVENVASEPVPYEKSTQDPYEVMSTIFIGNPQKEQVQPLMDAVLRKYRYELTDDMRLKVANMLFSLRKESAVGVTEMDILKHIYQRGSSDIGLADQAAISSVALESTK